MASGAEHDRFILKWTGRFMLASIPLTLLLDSNIYLLPAVFSVGFLVGGWWFSPDLDLQQSEPSQRWWLLRLLWIPYWKTRKHRGISHLPFVGTVDRLLLLLGWVLIIDFSIYVVGNVLPTELLFARLIELVSLYPHAAIALIAGVETAAQSHLWQDGILSAKYRELLGGKR